MYSPSKKKSKSWCQIRDDDTDNEVEGQLKSTNGVDSAAGLSDSPLGTNGVRWVDELSGQRSHGSVSQRHSSSKNKKQ